MAQPKAKTQEVSKPLWVCGMTPDLFDIPSQKTPVAVTAAAISTVLMDLADATTTLPSDTGAYEVLPSYSDTLNAEDASFHPAGWSEAIIDPDCSDRKEIWPTPDLTLIRPSASVEQRIMANIESIKLSQVLHQESRRPDSHEMLQLLSYCGWGGTARVFSPDGSQPQPLAHLREELKSLVGDADYAALQSSVNSAFFTDPQLVHVLWQIAEKLGFKGGRVLEPSAGVGHVIAGMPAHIAKRSDITAVELDPTSARLLERGFAPYGVQVINSGIESAKLPAGFFDLVIGNIPFGKYRSKDTSHSAYSDWSIHNYFLGKSLDLVRPGGLMVLITTQSSMDSEKDDHRRWLAAHADLLGAIRLPTMAFQKFANTEAKTDILVFKRKELPDFGANPHWVDLDDVPQSLMSVGHQNFRWASGHRGGSIKQEALANAYFVRHPHAVAGSMEWVSGQYGHKIATVYQGDMQALGLKLTQIIDQAVPSGVYTKRHIDEEVQLTSAFERVTNTTSAMPGAYVVQNGLIYLSEGDELLNIDSLYQGTARKRLLGMVEIRDAAIAVIEHQAQSDDDDQLKQLQQHLNWTYDAFVSSMGYLSTTANSRVMRADPNWPLMLALEVWDSEDCVAQKADIFFKRTVGKVILPSKVDSVKDAMMLSLAVFGRIDLKDMAMRSARPVAQVVQELRSQGLAFRDPVLAKWVPADEYLSGHIRDKIAQAKAAGPVYIENVDALEKVLPADLGPSEVEARLGAPWIPADVIKSFAAELINDTRDSIKVKFDSSTATWSIEAGYNKQYVGDHTLQNTVWGTRKRCALDLLEGALNQQPPTVMQTINDKSVVDPVETLNAREKWQAIRDEFRKWVYKDDVRRDQLLRIYNDLFNQVVPRQFDGSHLHLPGMTADVQPYPHQKNAIWRIMVNGNTLLAHCVGAGKTLVMVAASMELRRLGKARKPLHVVMNNCLEQYVAEAKRLYPQAKILMATKDDLSGDKRRTFCSRIATGDYDAVVMTQSTFERIMLSPQAQQDFIDAHLAEMRMNLQATTNSNAKRSIKELERRMKDYEAKLARLTDSGKADESMVWFEELGVDYVFLDEAHAYKNLGRLSKMPRIAGLPNTSSQRAFDTYMKTRVLMNLRGAKEEGIVMATATPVTNSLAELHTMQVYLQPQTLKRHGILEFDAWSASFGESVTGVELAPDGSGFRTNTRYAKFVNLPELMSIFRGVADIQTKEMLGLPTPRIEGGRPQTIVVEPSEALQSLTATFVERADAIRHRAVKPDEDNFLSVTNDGRRAALDVRLVDPTLPFDPQCKLAHVVEQVHRIWEEGASQRLTQLIFSDLGTPGGAGFSVYGELKRLLLLKGIPSDEIEFIQDHESDAAKAKLFKQVRQGVVRVLIGSTQKMGTGTNVQTRLKAIHQIDAPWVPSSVEQRDGRADRQGNQCESIELLRYVCRGSFDAYSWQVLDVKAKFIAQVMTSQKGLRNVEDVSMTALTYAEIKAIASGNPLVIEKVNVDIAVQKLTRSFDQWQQDRWRMSQRRHEIQQRLRWIDKHMDAFEATAQTASTVGPQSVFKPCAGAMLSLNAGMGTAESIGQAFRAVTRLGVMQTKTFGDIAGFLLSVERYAGSHELIVTSPDGAQTVTVNRPSMNETEATGQAVFKAIAGFTRQPMAMREEYGRKTEELSVIEAALANGFAQQAELDAALVRQREIEASLDLDKQDQSTLAMATD